MIDEAFFKQYVVLGPQKYLEIINKVQHFAINGSTSIMWKIISKVPSVLVKVNEYVCIRHKLICILNKMSFTNEAYFKLLAYLGQIYMSRKKPTKNISVGNKIKI